MELEALPLQHALELLADLAVHAGKDAVEEFDHRHLGPQPAPHRAELEANDAGANDDQLLRRLGERQRAGRGDDDFLVDLDAGQARHVGAGGDDDGLGFERLFLAVGVLDHDLAGRGDAPFPDDPVDLVLLEQEGDAGDVRCDGLVLVLHHRGEVELGLSNDDAERRQAVAGLLEHFRGVEQRLGGNAADVEAGAP